MPRVVMLGEGSAPRSTESVLQLRGHDVRRARDVAEAAAALADHRADPGAVVVALPSRESDAESLVHGVLGACPGVALVGAVSGEGRAAGWAALQAGAADITVLPLHPEEVAWRVERALSLVSGGASHPRVLELQARVDQLAMERDAASADRAALEGTLLKLAVADPLTGVANARAFEERLRAEVGRARRFSRPVCVLAMDVDHAARLEQAHGTAALQAALRRMGDHLREGLRETDLAARTDDDEFALLLPETPVAGARELALLLRRALASASDGAAGRVTVSMGVAQFDPARHADGAAVWAEARGHLARAKEAGRDRVEG